MIMNDFPTREMGSSEELMDAPLSLAVCSPWVPFSSIFVLKSGVVMPFFSFYADQEISATRDPLTKSNGIFSIGFCSIANISIFG